MKDIVLDNGKYVISSEDEVNIYATRYGEDWRDLTGDNLIYWLIQRIIELEDNQKIIGWASI